MTARDELITWLNGFIGGLAAVNGMAGKHPRFSARAFLLPDTERDIDVALPAYFEELCARLRDDIPGIDVTDFRFEPAEIHTNWTRWLHQEMEKKLLPAPCTIPRESQSATLQQTRYHVAWQVMEALRILTEDFQALEIYSARYTREEHSQGCLYALPLTDAYIVLDFQALELKPVEQTAGKDNQ